MWIIVLYTSTNFVGFYIDVSSIHTPSMLGVNISDYCNLNSFNIFFKNLVVQTEFAIIWMVNSDAIVKLDTSYQTWKTHALVNIFLKIIFENFLNFF